MEQDWREPQRAHVRIMAVASLILLALSAPKSVEAEKPRFTDFTGRFTREMLALQPVSATSVGYHHHTDARTGVTLALPRKLRFRRE